MVRSYRIPIAIQFLWAIILAVGLFVLPESPRFYVKKGKLEQAARSLARVRGQPIDSGYIQDELAEIIANHEYEKKVVPQTSYLEGWTNCFSGSIFKGNSNIRRTTVGILMQMMQQLTGINFIFYFGTVFFQSLGTISNPFLISLITTLVNVCSTPLSFYIVERFGRRKILITGAAGMITMQYIVGIIGVTAGRESEHNKAAVSAMIAFICFNISFFAATWGPGAWVVIGEIISVITPYLVGTDKGDANLGAKVFFMWGSLCIISFTFAYFLVPVSLVLAEPPICACHGLLILRCRRPRASPSSKWTR